MDIRKRVGLNLRRLRRERDISQEALALQADITRTYMSGIERGLENPTVEILNRLAGALYVPIADIVGPVMLPPRLRGRIRKTRPHVVSGKSRRRGI